MALSKKHPLIRTLSFQQLLNSTVGNLNLRFDDVLRECLIQIRKELKQRDIGFFPHFYFGEEPWGCINRTGSVEIPFFLANNELRQLAEKYYISYSKKEILMVLRHETGHAINYAYKMWTRQDWKFTFGKFHKPYRNFYHFNPASKDFVRHLHHMGNPHYAQKHPDEDFAETFAVWLDPSSKWKWHYRSWEGALEKLNYIERIFGQEKIAASRPLKVRFDESNNYKKIQLTVAEYFKIEKKIDPRVKEYLQDLTEIFSAGVKPQTKQAIRADLFIQNYAEYLENELATWIANTDRREVRSYLRELQTICALNNLQFRPDQATEKLVELVIIATYHLLKRSGFVR